MKAIYQGDLVDQGACIGLHNACLVGYEIRFHNQLPESCVLQSEIKVWVQQQFDQGLFDVQYSVEVKGAFEYHRARYYEQMGWTEE